MSNVITDNDTSLKLKELNDKVKNASFVFKYTSDSFNNKKDDHKKITIADNYIFKDFNGEIETEENPELAANFKKTIDDQFEQFKELSLKELENIKDSIMDERMFIQNFDEKFFLSRSGKDKEIQNFFDDLSEKVFKLLK